MPIRPELAKIKNAYKSHVAKHDPELEAQIDNKTDKIYEIWQTDPEEAQNQLHQIHLDTCLKLKNPVLIPAGTKLVCSGSGTSSAYTSDDCHVIGLTGIKPADEFCELLLDIPTVYAWNYCYPRQEITIKPAYICDTKILAEICEQL